MPSDVTAGSPGIAASPIGRRPPRATAVVVATLGVAALLAALVADQGGTRPLATPRVLVIGDSLVSLTAPALQRRLTADRWRATVVGLDGRTFAQVAAETRALRRRRWDAVAIWAGHNDALRSLPWTSADERVLRWAADQPCAAVMEIAPNYVADLAGPSGRPGPRHRSAQAVNQRLRDLARRHVDVRLVRWAAVAQERGREILFPDLVHVNPAGQALAAARMAGALLTCPTAPRS